MRLPYIDGLKGFGAFMVFLTHYRMMGLFSSYQGVWENPLLTFIMSGNIAVEIFIMVSAYSIALSVDRKWNGGQNADALKSIINKRYFRLALPVGILLALEGLLYPLGVFSPHDVAEQLGAHPTAVNAYQSLEYVDLIKGIFLSPIGKTYGWLSPAWMLCYIFYGTFIVIVLKIAVNSMLMSTKIFIYILFALLFSTISVHYLSIIVGCAMTEIKQERIAQNGLKGIILTIIIILMAFSIHVYFKSEFAHIIISGLVFWGVLLTSTLRALFSKRIFKWMGSISFSLYLIHWPLICSFSIWEYRLLAGYEMGQTFIVFVSTITILIFLSKLYYDHVENKLCRSIMTKISEVLR